MSAGGTEGQAGGGMFGSPQAPLVAAALLALLGLVAVLAAAPIACTDFFWHLELGEVILRERSIPTTDLFSAVHPDAAYVQPQWLWEVLAAAVYGAGGLGAIRLMQAVLLVLSFAALYVVARKLIGAGSLGLLCCALGLCLFVDRFRARPDALTLGFVALALPFLVDPYAARGRGGAWALFALALAWANLHGGASLLLLVSLAALLLGSYLDQRRGLVTRDQLRVAARLLGAALAGLALSPTLIPGMIHWASLIGAQIDTGNEEWLPTYTILRYGFAPQTLLVALLPSLVGLIWLAEQLRQLRREGRAALCSAEWLLCGGYLLLSHMAVRNAFLCLLPVVFMLRRQHAAGLTRAARALAAAGACLLALIVAQDVFARSMGGLESARRLYRAPLMPNTYPEQAGDFLAGAGIEGGIFNEGKWGGYLIQRCYPACHVFVDTRQNLTPEMWSVFLASLSAEKRVPALAYAFRTWGVELALFRGPTFPLIVPPAGWRLLYKAGDQELYQQLDGKHAAANLERARRWLRAAGATQADALDAATEVGARIWLAQAPQRAQQSAAEAQIASGAAPSLAQGHAALGELFYRAGLYARAAEHFASAERSAAPSTAHLYFHALSRFAAGDVTGAARLARRLEARDVRELSPRQRERLQLLRGVLMRGQGS